MTPLAAATAATTTTTSFALALIRSTVLACAPQGFARGRTLVAPLGEPIVKALGPRLRAVERPFVTAFGPRLRMIERPLVTALGPRLRAVERPLVTALGPRLRAVERPLVTAFGPRLRAVVPTLGTPLIAPAAAGLVTALVATLTAGLVPARFAPTRFAPALVATRFTPALFAAGGPTSGRAGDGRSTAPFVAAAAIPVAALAPAAVPVAIAAFAARAAPATLLRLGDRRTAGAPHHAHAVGPRPDAEEAARALLEDRDHHFRAGETQGLQAVLHRRVQRLAFEYVAHVGHASPLSRASRPGGKADLECRPSRRKRTTMDGANPGPPAIRRRMLPSAAPAGAPGSHP